MTTSKLEISETLLDEKWYKNQSVCTGETTL